MSSAGTQRRNFTGPQVITPAQLGQFGLTCELWLDASKLSSLTADGSSRVSQWNDLSGKGRHVTQATNTNKPKTELRTINGLNALEFFHGGNDQWLEVDEACVSAPPFTMIVVCEIDSDSKNQALVWLGDKDSAADMWLLRAMGTVGSDPLELFAQDSASNQVRTSAGYSPGTPLILTGVESSAASRSAYKDKGNSGTNSSSLSPDNADRTSIGRAGDSSPGDYLDGLIAEVIVVSADLTLAKHTRVWDGLHQYLADKWGVTLA